MSAKPGTGAASAAGASKNDAGPKKTDEELLRWLRFISQLEAKLAKDPYDYNLMLRLADAYGQLGVEQREKVVSFATMATLSGADDARVDVVLGDYYLRVKDLTSAIRSYLRVLDVAPEHCYTLVQLRASVLSADPDKVDIDLKLLKKILNNASKAPSAANTGSRRPFSEPPASTDASAGEPAGALTCTGAGVGVELGSLAGARAGPPTGEEAGCEAASLRPGTSSFNSEASCTAPRSTKRRLIRRARGRAGGSGDALPGEKVSGGACHTRLLVF